MLTLAYNVLLAGQDNVIYCLGVRNELTGEYINDAVVEGTLTDMQDNEVGGQVWPMVFDYVLGSEGNYRFLVENTADLVAGEYYKMNINLTGDGLTASWSYTLKAEKRA